jgi:phosphoglycerol transferase
MNFAWLAMVVLSGLSATWCIGTLGASRTSALVAGTLFALTPYALYRSTGHFWLVIYLVPFAGTASLMLASGRPERWYWGRPFLALLAGCTLLAFDYAYYAFFACGLLIVAALAGSLQHRTFRLIGAGALCVALIAGGTAINLTPSFLSWHRIGRPLMVPDKTPAEAEVYGLKIRQLISPGLWHRFPPFRAWLDREAAAGFPLETENGSTRLGVVATVGFLILIGLLFAPGVSQALAARETLLAASRLTLAAVLLATIGGFGSVINLLVTPEIRAYNRIAPFIAFFALTAVALLLDAMFTSRRRVAAALAVALVGLADQRAAAVYLNSIHKDVAAEYASLEVFVANLERQLPAGSMVFELPVRAYPEDTGGPLAQPYENLKPYLVSRTLRWSDPALANQQARWHQAAARLSPGDLAHELAAGGFEAVLIDRTGYADSGTATVAALRQADLAPLSGETPRYVAFDLRPLASTPPATSVLARAAGSAPASAGVPACGRTPLLYLDRVGSAVPPFADPLALRGSQVKVSGWAVDEAAAATAAGVDLVVDDARFQTIYGTDRPDVAAKFAQPRYAQSGFLGAVPTGRFQRGPHTLAFRVVSADGRCYDETPPLRIVIE